MIYEFGPYRISSEERVLCAGGSVVPIAPKAADVLLALLARAEAVVSNDELIESVWPAGDVGEANLTQNIYLLRRLFRRHGAGIRIQNVRKRGYRLVVPEGNRQRSPRRRAYWCLEWSLCAAALAAVALSAVHLTPRDSRGSLSAFVLRTYLLGEADERAGGAARLASAARRFMAVTAQAPGSALGYAGLAESDVSLSYYAADASKAIALQADAIALARKAVAVDSSSADAYAALGAVALSVQHDDGLARRAFDRALALDPDQLGALLWEGTLFQSEGRLAASHRLFAHALAVAPDSPGVAASLAWSDFLMRDYASAIAFSNQMLRARELPSLAGVTLANAYLAIGRHDLAARSIRRLVRDAATGVQAVALAARLDVARGRRAQAALSLRRLDDALDPRVTDDWDAAALAAAYLAVGDRDRAYVWLARVHRWERREDAVDPRFAALRHDARFAAWLDV